LDVLEYEPRILFDGYDLQGYDTIKVAEIRRGTQQARPFELSDDYAPPSLRVGASKVLKKMTHGVLQHLHRTLASIPRETSKAFGAAAGSRQAFWKALRSQAQH